MNNLARNRESLVHRGKRSQPLTFGCTFEGKMVFDAFRNKPFPTLYGPSRSAVTVDVLEIGLIVAFLSIAFSMLLILPGVKDWRQVGITNTALSFLFEKR